VIDVSLSRAASAPAGSRGHATPSPRVPDRQPPAAASTLGRTAEDPAPPRVDAMCARR
jgi:hypothetical protein